MHKRAYYCCCLYVVVSRHGRCEEEKMMSRKKGKEGLTNKQTKKFLVPSFPWQPLLNKPLTQPMKLPAPFAAELNI